MRFTEEVNMRFTTGGWSTESRIRYTQPPLPEGWRFCHNNFNQNTGKMMQLRTNAPKSTNPWEKQYETEWVEMVPFTEQRHVTEWVRV